MPGRFQDLNPQVMAEPSEKHCCLLCKWLQPHQWWREQQQRWYEMPNAAESARWDLPGLERIDTGVERGGLKEDSWRSTALPSAPDCTSGSPPCSPIFYCPPGADRLQMHRSPHAIAISQHQPHGSACPLYISSWQTRFNITKTKHVFLPSKSSCLYSPPFLCSLLPLTTLTLSPLCKVIVQEITDSSSLLLLYFPQVFSTACTKFSLVLAAAVEMSKPFSSMSVWKVCSSSGTYTSLPPASLIWLLNVIPFL